MTTLDFDTALRRVLGAADTLPTPSDEALELQGQAMSNASVTEIAAHLDAAPHLLDRLLRLASVGQLATGPRARNAADACTRLGRRPLAALALASDYALIVRDSPALHDTARHCFARRAVTTAVTARSLARRSATAREEDAFLAGLLLGVGQLAMAGAFPQAYNVLIDRASGRLPSASDELARLGFDHGPIDEVLLQHWGVRSGLRAAVGSAAVPERLPLEASTPESRDLCELLHTALLASRVTLENGTGRSFLDLDDALSSRYGLPVGGAEEFLRSVAPAMAEVTELLDFPAGPGLDLATVAEEAAEAVKTQEAEGHAIEDQLREWSPTTRGLSCSVETGLMPESHLRDAMLEALALRADNGAALPMGVLVLRLDATRAGVGQEVLDLVRASDVAFESGTDHVILLAPNTTPVSLRALAQRLASDLDAGAHRRGEEVVRIGGATAGQTRRACEADLLLREAWDALERAAAADDDSPSCRVAGLT
ncbi:MAG: HDOD domain-containing protein [Planctomycetota bacterium]